MINMGLAPRPIVDLNGWLAVGRTPMTAHLLKNISERVGQHRSVGETKRAKTMLMAFLVQASSLETAPYLKEPPVNN